MIRLLLAHHLAPCEHLVSQISLFAHNKAFMGTFVKSLICARYTFLLLGANFRATFRVCYKIFSFYGINALLASVFFGINVYLPVWNYGINVCNMLKRKISKQIENYLKSGGDKMLVVDGARQIGKSFIIREIGSRMFPNFIEINMEKDKQGDRLFAEAKTTENFYLALSVVAGDRMSDKKSTLVFIDEIQAYDHLLTLVKFLMEDGRFTYIASGSLLGVTLKPRWSASNGVFTNICPKIVPNN